MTFYLKFSLVLLVLFTLPMLLIHAQPYDDHELREFLMPDGCEMPCFMGIQPGGTTVAEAVTLLRASGWVKSIRSVDSLCTCNPDKTIKLTWNGSEPQVFKTTWLQEPMWMVEHNGIVIDIQIATNFTLGEVWLLLGSPERGGIDFVFDGSELGSSHNNNVYPKLGFRVEAYASCPIMIDRFWNSPQILVFFVGENRMGLYDPHYLTRFMRAYIDPYQTCWDW